MMEEQSQGLNLSNRTGGSEGWTDKVSIKSSLYIMLSKDQTMAFIKIIYSTCTVEKINKIVI